MQLDRKTKSLEKALLMPPENIISIIKNSGLEGRGGANFPTGQKWEFARKAKSGTKVLICNADEGEPGTFKDRYIIMHNPDGLIEGIIIASYALGATHSFMYLRKEYENLKSGLEAVISKYKTRLEDLKLSLEVFIGAGAYICGDETAILNSLEGKRGEPRQKPPYPSDYGLFGYATVINNVETLANVPIILDGDWKQLRLFSVSGNVKSPGVYEFPLGTKAGELLQKANPQTDIKALYFGCSGGCVPYQSDLSLDFKTIHSRGASLSSCTVIAIDKNQSIPKVCKNIAEFFVEESCGKCVPCREGNLKIFEILENIDRGKGQQGDIEQLASIGKYVDRFSLCGLGKSSNLYLLNSIKYFKEEFEEKCK